MTKEGTDHNSNKASINERGRSFSSFQAIVALVLLVSHGVVMPSRALAQTFNDVPTDYWAFEFIEQLAQSGITSGCGGDNYCPEDPVTRAQMAVFLERGIRGSGFSPPAATGNTFLDVGASDFAAAFIEQFFLDGITGGCGGNNYCPNDAVTRAQMAVFLLRAEHGAGFIPPPASLPSQINVTNIVQNWADGIFNNFGFFVEDTNYNFPFDTQLRSTTYCSKEGVPSCIRPPELVITYQ